MKHHQDMEVADTVVVVVDTIVVVVVVVDTEVEVTMTADEVAAEAVRVLALFQSRYVTMV